jgi:N-acetylglucosaminyldiphosphoundecaprenol N-acetyl-beta-D-mannosaminyltransferase
MLSNPMTWDGADEGPLPAATPPAPSRSIPRRELCAPRGGHSTRREPAAAKAGGGSLLGIAIDPRPLAEHRDEALAAIERRRGPVVFACVNPHSMAAAQNDASFSAALNGADQLVADGVGVVLMAKLARLRIGPRITGTDYFLAIMRALEHRGGGRIFFFGSTEGVLRRISERVLRDFPSLTVCGTYSPPFRAWSEQENAQMLAGINAARPDVLWVGMTAPRQEKWVQRNRQALHAPVIASIGAVFDFLAGTHARAPRWMCKIGAEWLYRLAREPKRMWRRTFVSAPLFVALVIWRHMLQFGRRGETLKDEHVARRISLRGHSDERYRNAA